MSWMSDDYSVGGWGRTPEAAAAQAAEVAAFWAAEKAAAEKAAADRAASLAAEKAEKAAAEKAAKEAAMAAHKCRLVPVEGDRPRKDSYGTWSRMLKCEGEGPCPHGHFAKWRAEGPTEKGPWRVQRDPVTR